MKRSQLVIQNKTLKKLERKPDEEGEKITSEELAKTLRVWTDSTGEFKIEAFYISHTEKKVVLKTALPVYLLVVRDPALSLPDKNKLAATVLNSVNDKTKYFVFWP